MIKFVLPGLAQYDKLNSFFATIIKNESLNICNYKETMIVGEEGNLPGFYWSNSTFNNNSKIVSRDIVEDMEKNIFDQICGYIDCSNSALIEGDLLDTKQNQILQLFENGSNYAIVSTPMMIDFFETHYPQYHLIGSEQYQYHDPDKKYLHKLFHIRQSYRDINNNFYNDIPKSKIDLGISTNCLNCEHYQNCVIENNYQQLLFMRDNIYNQCNNKTYNLLTPQEINTFIQKGYTNFYFSMECFNNSLERLIQFYIDVFILPEHREEFYHILAKEFLWNDR